MAPHQTTKEDLIMELNLSKTTMMLDLSKAAPSLTRLRGVLNWDCHPVHGASKDFGFDLDVFAFLTDAKGSINGDVANVVFFNNMSAYNGAVVYPRDNRTGEGDDDEELITDITKIPAHIHKVEHFVFLHEAEKRQQDFSMIKNGSFKLFDQDGNLIQDYKLATFVGGTALHIGTLQRQATGGWGFQPVGESAVADPNQVLSAFA
jgi:tellurium resistance protein TerD